MKRSRTDNKVYSYMGNLIEESGAKDEDKIKLALLANKFYEDNKEDFDNGKVSAQVRKNIMLRFLVFTIQFETVVVKANKPLTGSGSSSREIIRLYHEKQQSELSTLALKALDELEGNNPNNL